MNSTALETTSECLLVCEEIFIGQWCLFKHRNKIEKKVLLGLVLGFAKINGNTYSSRNYSQKSCKVVR